MTSGFGLGSCVIYTFVQSGLDMQLDLMTQSMHHQYSVPQLDSNLFTIQFHPIILPAPPSLVLFPSIFFPVTLHDACI